MILYEFDDCYKMQHFYEGKSPIKIDFTTLEGVNGYCDDKAKAYILDIVKNNNSSLAFLGNGNFHYMSYLLLHKVNQDFSLLVLDHHPDMQPSFFEELLSCGCWIKHALDNLSYLKEAMVLGVKQQLLEELIQTEGFEFLGRQQGIYRYQKNGKSVICVEEQFFVERSKENIKWCGQLQKLLKEGLSYPVYVSVDKDVLAESDCVTNWDAGSMTLDTMMKVLHLTTQEHKIFAMDVCGEWDGLESTITETPAQIIKKNNRCNQMLAEWWDKNKE